jgi:peptidoglycan hydrolase-like protein with peptidoglycan-binding domain
VGSVGWNEAGIDKAGEVHREEKKMRIHAPLAALLVATALPATMAAAQTAAPLTYAQPLSPQAIRAVQQRLRQVGAYSGNEDGIWGRDSEAALERYQQSHGLQVSGQLNQATLATLGINPGDLLALGAGPAPTPPTQQSAAEPLSPPVTRSVQARLKQLGFYQGPTDGVYGANTQAAIERFQQSRGLQPSGQLNPGTATAMGLDANNLSAPTPLSGSSSPRR